MTTSMTTATTSPALIPGAVQPASGKEYTDDEVRQLVAALEEPFDPQDIKRRVTNTTRDRTRGQVIAKESTASRSSRRSPYPFP
jgi:hypothetical protein